MLIEILRRHKPFETAQDIADVLVYEVGDAVKSIHHMKSFPENRVAEFGFLITHLSDAYAQIVLLCEWYGIPLRELQFNAYESFKKTMEERFPIKEEGPVG